MVQRMLMLEVRENLVPMEITWRYCSFMGLWIAKGMGGHVDLWGVSGVGVGVWGGGCVPCGYWVEGC